MSIREIPTKAIEFAKLLGEIPDHVQALGVLAAGTVIKIVRPHESSGDALIAAGLAMWKGKQ